MREWANNESPHAQHSSAQLSTAQHSREEQSATQHRSPLTDQRVSAPSPSVTSLSSLFTTISECLHGLFYLNSIYISSESTPPNKSRSLPSAESPNMPPRPKENVSTMVSHTCLALSAPSSPVSHTLSTHLSRSGTTPGHPPCSLPAQGSASSG